MDTTSTVTDGDGLIFHYRAGLYRQTKKALQCNAFSSKILRLSAAATHELTLSADTDKNDSQHCRPTMLARVSQVESRQPSANNFEKKKNISHYVVSCSVQK